MPSFSLASGLGFLLLVQTACSVSAGTPTTLYERDLARRSKHNRRQAAPSVIFPPPLFRLAIADSSYVTCPLQSAGLTRTESFLASAGGDTTTTCSYGEDEDRIACTYDSVSGVPGENNDGNCPALVAGTPNYACQTTCVGTSPSQVLVDTDLLQTVCASISGAGVFLCTFDSTTGDFIGTPTEGADCSGVFVEGSFGDNGLATTDSCSVEFFP